MVGNRIIATLSNGEKVIVSILYAKLLKAMLRAIISAAEEASPVIINISPRQMKTHGMPEILAPMIKKMAEEVNVPVALNLDHGQEYNDVMRVIKAGFSSVMIDASACDYEENINRTRLIASIAHENGLYETVAKCAVSFLLLNRFSFIA